MEIVTCISQINKTVWSDFVIKHPNGNIFQTPEMYQVYLKTKNYEPVFLAVENENKEILGVLLAVVQKEHKGLLGIFSSRAIIMGGPLIHKNDPDVLDFILKEYNLLVKKKAIYSQCRNFWDWREHSEIFSSHGFLYEDHLNIIIDLKKSEEQLWSEVHSKRRNEIRRSLKEGTLFVISNTVDSLKICYQILKNVYSRAKLPLPSYEHFQALHNNSTDKQGLCIFTATYEGEIIGCLLGLVYKEVVYDYYAGALDNFYNKYPNDLIPWEVIKYVKQNGFTTFDFGGAGKPNVPYGVRDYKKKFGGDLVNYGRFEKVNKPIMYRMGKFGLKIYKKIKS